MTESGGSDSSAFLLLSQESLDALICFSYQFFHFPRERSVLKVMFKIFLLLDEQC